MNLHWQHSGHCTRRSTGPGTGIWLVRCAVAFALWIAMVGASAAPATTAKRTLPTAPQDFGFAEPYFETLDLSRSQSLVVSAVVQDAQGWLWIGTDEGLLRYDGYRMKKFVHDDANPASLAGNFITALWQGKDGRLWVGTFSNGVSVFDPRNERFTHFPHDPAQPASLTGAWVHAFAEDKAGGVWIGTNQGLDYVGAGQPAAGDPGAGQPAAGPPALRHYRHDPNNPTSLLANRVRSLLIDKQGALWIGSFSGLQRYQPGATAPAASSAAVGFVRIASDPANPNSLAGQEVMALFQAQDGKLWVGTKKQGAAWFNPAATKQAASPDSNNPALHWLLPDPQRTDRLSHGCVYTIAQPQAGKIWLGTFGGGINIVSAQDGTVLQRLKHDPANASSLTHDNVSAILPDRSGMLWIGSRGGGLQRHHPAQAAFHVLRYSNTRPGGLSHPEVRSVLELADGRILVGTGDKGIDILDRQQGIIGGYRAQPGVPGSLPDATIRALLQTPDGTLWAGTQQAGAARLLPGSRVWQTFSVAQGLPSPVVNQFLVTRDGTLWAATVSGVARWQPQTQRFEPARQSNGHIFQNYVPAMAEDGQGRLWAASNIGLWLKASDDPGWQLIRNQATRPESLVDDDVWGLLVDANDRLWVATSRGLDRLQKWDGRNAVFEHISAKAGKPGLAIGENLWQDRQGRIWIDHGGQMLDPQTLRFTNNASPDLGTTWRGAHGQTRDGWLMYGGSRGLAIFDPGKFQPWAFQAMVEQRTAEAVAAHNEAVAAQLEAVSAQNELALARQLEQAREQMLQQEKMAALGTLTAGVAHEINNPTNFTHVAAQIQREELDEFEQFLLDMLADEPDPDLIAAFKKRFTSLNSNITTMLNGTERIQTIVKDLRAFSRREHEQKRTLPLSACLISTLNLVRINWSRQVEFITDFADDPPYECWPTLLGQVFMNLMVNGCHAIADKRRQQGECSARGHLWLRLRQCQRDGQKWLVAEIEDDGCGIEPAVRERILEPFFTTKDIDTGTGLGLSIAHGIIQKHNGTLEITSTPGQGSCFAVYLPQES